MGTTKSPMQDLLYTEGVPMLEVENLQAPLTAEASREALYNVVLAACGNGSNMIVDGTRIENCEKRLVRMIETHAGLAIPFVIDLEGLADGENWYRSPFGHYRAIAIITKFERAPKSLLALLDELGITYIGVLSEEKAYGVYGWNPVVAPAY